MWFGFVLWGLGFVIAAGCDFGFVCVHVDVVEVVGLGVVGLGLHIWSLRCVCVWVLLCVL